MRSTSQEILGLEGTASKWGKKRAAGKVKRKPSERCRLGLDLTWGTACKKKKTVFKEKKKRQKRGKILEKGGASILAESSNRPGQLEVKLRRALPGQESSRKREQKRRIKKTPSREKAYPSPCLMKR